MGVPSQARDFWARATRNNTTSNNSFVIPSPAEDQRVSDAHKRSIESITAGAKAAVIAGTVTAVPTLVACRTVPWAKANLNYTAQALIISAASIAAFFITADKSILESARKSAQYDKTR